MTRSGQCWVVPEKGGCSAVKKYLVEKFGVDASRITTTGYGPSKPVADNASDSGRQQNRRVEAVIETMINKQ